MDYFSKQDNNDYQDLKWNLPEQKRGIVNIIGGNIQNFRTEIKTAEFLANAYPVKEARLVLPDVLKSNLPELPNIVFLPSTESGSYDESQAMANVFNTGDFNLVLGDLSKNSITGGAIAGACQRSEKMTLLTRDTIDIIASNTPEKTIINENLILFATLAQLQKLLRAVYYPKMLQLSQSLIQVSETLYKFTLSYPVRIITIHGGQILFAENGNIRAIPLEKSSYSPTTIWGGELAAKISCMNLYNPNNFLSATSCAVFD